MKAGTVRIGPTTPATRWENIVSFPHDFDPRPKAIMVPLDDIGSSVVLRGADGNDVTFVLALGVPIQVQPVRIVSSSYVTIIALYD